VSVDVGGLVSVAGGGVAGVAVSVGGVCCKAVSTVAVVSVVCVVAVVPVTGASGCFSVRTAFAKR
jgi:hypothetical protein